MFKKALLAAALCITSLGGAAQAGTVALFSDVDLYRSGATNPGNQQILANLLGDGDSVFISRRPGVSDVTLNLRNAFTALPGVSVQSSDIALGLAPLMADDLLILNIGYDINESYSIAEEVFIRQFILNGGDVGIIYEPGTRTLSANSFFASIGLNMRIGGQVAPGIQTTTNIAATPLTSGVSSVTFGYHGAISGGTGAVFSGNGDTLIAFQQFGTAEVPLPPGGGLLLAAGGLLGLLRLRKRA